MSKRKKDHRLTISRGVAGLERAEALAKGGQQAQIWRSGGVKSSLTTDRRKRANKMACRGRYRGGE